MKLNAAIIAGALALACVFAAAPARAQSALDFAAAGMGRHEARIIYPLRRHMRRNRWSRRRMYAEPIAGAPQIVRVAMRYIGTRNPMRFRGPGCKAFINMVARRSGYVVTASMRAFDTRGMGRRVSRPEPGDYRVSARRGGGHTELVARVEGGHVLTINGNKGRNRVGWSYRSIGGATYYRPIRAAWARL